MKPLLASALSLLALPLVAQTSTTTTTTTPPAGAPSAPASGQPPTPGGMMAQLMSVLTPAEQTQLTNARTKAMSDNPALQTEEMDLMQKGLAMQGGELTDVQRKAFMDEVNAHKDKVRAAMIKADPTVEPLIKKVEAKAEEMRAQYAH